MKARARLCLSARFVLLIGGGMAVGSEGATGSEPALLAVRFGAEIARGPYYQVVQVLSDCREPDGTVATHTNMITVLASGMFYLKDGEWVESTEEIEALPGGLVARQGPHQVIFPADIAAPDEGGVLDLLTSDQNRFRSRILGLSYYDPATGQSVLIAELKPSPAELIAPNRVIYRDGFTDLQADVVYDYRKASFSQDIVLRGNELPVPSQFGLGDGVWLEVVTEFLEAPEPRKERRTVPAWSAGTSAVPQPSPTMVDDSLDFGVYQMGPGQAFWLDAGNEADLTEPGVLVLKRWEVIEGRTFLFESVPLAAIQPLVAQLPRQARAGGQPGEQGSEAAGGQTATRDQGSANIRLFGSRAALVRALPAKPRDQASKYAAAPLKSPIANTKSQVAHSALRAPPSALRSGLVLDFTYLYTATNVTLAGDTTYYVSGTVNLSGTTTIEGGTVVKFTNTPTAAIICLGSVVCQTGPYRPAVFTGLDDNTVGAILPWSTGNPTTNYYANPALELCRNGQLLHDLRIAHAQKGIFFYDFSAVVPNTVRHAQLVRCNTALQANGYGTYFQNFTLGNVLIHNAGTAIYGYSFTGRVEQLTLDQCNQLAYDYNGQLYGTTSHLDLVNSLLVGVSSTGNVPMTTTCCYWTTNSGVFQRVGAGWHYLPEDSPYRGLGQGDISSALGDELVSKTTEAPQVLTNLMTLSAAFRPRAHRAAGCWSLDPGFYYDPIDVAVGTLIVTNGATLTLKPNLALATFCDHGIRLEDYGHLVAEGTPSQPVRVFRYNVVQEQSTNWGNWTYEPLALVGPAHASSGGSAPPTATLRFTQFLGLADYGVHIYTENNWWLLSWLALRDCEFRSGKAQFCGGTSSTVTLTNDLFAKCAVSFLCWPAVTAYNNLFRQGSVRLERWAANAWIFKDNAFHDTVLTDIYGGTTNGYNGYLGVGQAQLRDSLGSDVVLTNFSYSTSYFGEFYQASTNLIDKGSRNATNAGLYHYTTQSSQAKETNSPVDIGLHYVAGQTNKIEALDSDHDGLYDYQEDLNGNGYWEANGTCWSWADPDGDGLSDGDEIAWGTKPLVADTDGDGVSDGREVWWRGTNPRDALSKEPVRLGYWRFDNTLGFTNEAGIGPLQVTNVTLTNSFVGLAADFSQAGALLRYPCSTNAANYTNDPLKYVDLLNGGVRFSYSPDWYHGSNSDHPSADCTLLQVGAWRVRILADGHHIVFESPKATGETNQNIWALLPRQGESPFAGRTNWEITLNYTWPKSWLLINGIGTDDDYGPASGLGVEANPSAEAITNGLHVGCSPGGVGRAQGRIDELETFNAPVGKNLNAGYDTLFARLWDNIEWRSEILTATAPSGQGQLDLRWVRGWEGDPQLCPANYAMYRRKSGETNWGLLATNLFTDHCSDTTPTPGQLYEYRLNRLSESPTNLAVLRGAPQHHRGRALLLVDGTLALDLTNAIAQFQQDLQADGWSVYLTNNMPRHDHSWTISSDTYKTNLDKVKQAIMGQWNQYKASETSLTAVLIGHVTIPYSGNTAEDGHGDHGGAWPADIYYGDMDGVWTDTNATNNVMQPVHNVPGDGKWDQDYFPANSNGLRELEVAVGRIDFASMYTFTNATYLTNFGMTIPPSSYTNVELALIRNYFNKAHLYRTKSTNAQANYAVDHTWRCYLYNRDFEWLLYSLRSAFTRLDGNLDVNYMVGTNEIVRRDVFDFNTNYDGVYLWGIHGAYGQWNAIATSRPEWRYSEEFKDTANNPKTLFYLLTGSYFADWMWGYGPEYTNNFMRACLGTRDYGLASMWSFSKDPVSGPWRMDRLALGYHLGAALQDTIRLNPLQSCRTVYILGDPTLRCYVVAPASNLNGTPQGNQVHLTWTAPPEAVDGYYVYRGANLEGALQSGPLNTNLITTTYYTDQNVPTGSYTYAVRASRLVSTGAGSFHNLSQAIKTQVEVGQ